jgi:hypothetical protein
VQKCGNVIAVGDDRAGAVSSARAGVGALTIRLRPCVETTTRYLFHESGNDAFASLDTETRRLIAGLPLFRGNPEAFVEGAAIPIEELPGFAHQRAEDWHGMAFGEAVHRSLLRAGGLIAEPGAVCPFVLSGLFWRGILRGSMQAGIYILDSVRSAAAGRRLPELLAEA